MQVTPIKTSVFKENGDLIQFILKYVKKIPESSILVVTSKVVALSEGRTAIYKSERQKAEIIKKESKKNKLAIKTKLVWLTIKDGMVMANAGIDESNADRTESKLILLPKNSFDSAEIIRRKLLKIFGLKNLGILITDSRLMPLRTGVVGVALGYAGIEGIKSYIGEEDIFGRILKMSKTNVADSLATSAVLCMGEGKEQQPLAVITAAPVIFTKKVKRNELIIDPSKDIYAPLFAHLKTKKKNEK